MATKYQNKEQAQAKSGQLGAYSPVYIHDRYAQAHGLQRGGWYVMVNNQDRKFL